MLNGPNKSGRYEEFCKNRSDWSDDVMVLLGLLGILGFCAIIGLIL